MGLQYSKYLSFDHIKKTNQASKCPQSAKKRTLSFKKKWLRKQSLKRLQQRQRKKRPKNNVFKNKKQQIKTSKPRCKNLLYNKTPDTQQNNIKAEFILKKKETIFNTL